MATYKVNVRIDLEYEVECDNEADAEAQGWLWEDYIQYSEVYSIDVEDITESDEEEEEG
jgi:hypothetical protein